METINAKIDMHCVYSLVLFASHCTQTLGDKDDDTAAASAAAAVAASIWQ